MAYIYGPDCRWVDASAGAVEPLEFGPMATREQLIRVVLDLPEDEIDPTLDFIASRHEDPVARLLDNAPEDDEPLTTGDEEALAEAYAELDGGAPTMPVDEFRRLHG
jgi:hypothetical protein